MIDENFYGLPCPVPVSESKNDKVAWVYRLALSARSELLRYEIGDTLTPIATGVSAAVTRWCLACDDDDPLARDWLTVNGCDPFAVAWLAAAIAEILCLDPVTQAWLSSHRLPSRVMRKDGE